MGIRIGVLGATRAVGREMIKVIEEYGLDVDELRLLASPRSEGTMIPFCGREVEVHAAAPSSFEGLDYVLGAVGKAQAREYAPYITESGAVFIDNSSAFRMEQDVPLVVPEINGSDALNNRGIISNPNCSTIITCMAVAGINRLSPIESIVASTYQAVSGAGQGGLDELEQQVNAYVNGGDYEIKKFPEQIVMNVIPFIGSMTDNGTQSHVHLRQSSGDEIAFHLHHSQDKEKAVRRGGGGSDRFVPRGQRHIRPERKRLSNADRYQRKRRCVCGQSQGRSGG